MIHPHGRDIRHVAAGIALMLASIPGASAVPVFNPATGHWYDVVSSGASGAWANAEANAIALGGHLVTINDAAEDAWLRATFGASTRFWIGYTDTAVEGTFVWSSGETPGYVNWDGGEPNDSMPPAVGEDFTVMNWDTTTGEWNDWDHRRSDYTNTSGIAEWSVPEPGSLALLGFALLGAALVRRYRAKVR